MFLMIAFDLSFKVARLNWVSEATSFNNSIALSEVVSMENSYKLETIRLFISSTALLVNVMARIFRYASSFVAKKRIFKYLVIY